jgi:hypothetical protein
MQRYLTPIQQAESTDTIQRIPVDDSPVGVYRLDDGSHEVVAEVDGRTQSLGVRDVGVSRKKGDVAPVELRPAPAGLKVENKNSTNPIVVETSPTDHELAKDEYIEITDDCTIKLGIEVQIRANVRGATDEADDTMDVEDTPDGPEMEAYLDALTENITLRVQNDEVADCRNKLQELHDTIVEKPVDAEPYDEIEGQVGETMEKLEAKINDQLRSKTIGEQLEDEIDHLTSRVVKMYDRN